MKWPSTKDMMEFHVDPDDGRIVVRFLTDIPISESRARLLFTVEDGRIREHFSDADALPGQDEGQDKGATEEQ